MLKRPEARGLQPLARPRGRAHGLRLIGVNTLEEALERLADGD